MSDAPTHWLYPTNESSSYYLINVIPGEPDLPVTPENVLAQIELAPDRPDSWYLSTGYRLMRDRDAVWLYAAGEQVIYALGRVANRYTDDAGEHHANLHWDLPATRRLALAPIPRSSFHEVPQSVRRANPTTVALLRTWMKSHEVTVSATDDLDGDLSEGDARTKILRQIAQRRGQDRFRQQLLAAYKGRCAVTGETAREVLEAAHIKTHRGADLNDVRNGLLLRSDIHTLFDLNLLGIDSKARIVVSGRLKQTSYWSLNGKPATLPTATSSRPSKKLLAERLGRLVVDVKPAGR